MPLDRAELAMRELVSSFTCLESSRLMDSLARAAAAVVRVGYAGFVRVDPLREEACAVLTHVPPGDPLRIRHWLAECGVLKELAVSRGPVLLACDRSVGTPGFLATPMATVTCDHAFLWAAGRAFDDRDEHLLGRFAIAAGRALEASNGLEAAARLLRGVQSLPSPPSPASRPPAASPPAPTPADRPGSVLLRCPPTESSLRTHPTASRGTPARQKQTPDRPGPSRQLGKPPYGPAPFPSWIREDRHLQKSPASAGTSAFIRSMSGG